MTRKSPMDHLLDQVVWEALPAPGNQDDTMPYAIRSGELRIPGFPTALRVYQLNTGQRVINSEDLVAFFGMGEEAG